MTEIQRTISIITDDDYPPYEVYTGEILYVKYIERDGDEYCVSFASKAEMKAVALAMLELSEKE